MIDLTKDIEEIKSNVRKRYKSHINWGIKNMSIEVYDKTNITESIIEDFRILHINVAGRETRSKNTWTRQYQSVKKGESFVVCGKIEGAIVSQGLFNIYNKHCYYSVSASRRELFLNPIFHAIMWRAIEFAKSLNIERFETGIDEVDKANISMLSAKENNIADFKRGFGGLLYKIDRAIKS